MKYLLMKLLLLITLLFPGLVMADIAVLIHGYYSSANTWRGSGIVSLLSTKGWIDTGYYIPYAGHIGGTGYKLTNTGKYIVTVDLPSQAPVEVQSDLLDTYLKDMAKNYPQQKIRLIAHSAGGIVARLSLVRNYSALSGDTNQQFIPIIQLITIATPHHGSPIAEMAKTASDSPIGLFAPLVGLSEINRAEVLYKQLSRENENHFLYWLNRQAHPPIAYTSIVRADHSLLTGDLYVPSYSQNMATVPAIGPQSQLIMSPGAHNLRYTDGMILMGLLP